ncbi:hypothetical protein YW3DRAFT_07162 [Streptomyces sp. MnatMP-M77]|nr:hypothetical protein [Streptomyces sp. MnatMP-M77]SBV03940.1 hypothetical protein YW3DRAFT_07162 [Streptomyces sp. MnatMP-M77]
MTSWTARSARPRSASPPRIWDGYKRHPLLTEHVIDVGGVEH